MATVAETILRAAELSKNVRRGTATGGNATTLVDANHPTRADDYYNQGTIWFLTGNNAGKTATITDWVNSTHTFTFVTPGAACAAADLYAALPASIVREALVGALNNAMADCGKVEASLDITAVADTNRYAITIPGSMIHRVETLAAGTTTGVEYYWFRVEAGYLYLDAHVPGAGDTIRVFYTDTPARVALDADVVNVNLDALRLAWLTMYYALVPMMTKAENTDAGLKEVFALATNERNEFMARRPARVHARLPHLSNY